MKNRVEIRILNSPAARQQKSGPAGHRREAALKRRHAPLALAFALVVACVLPTAWADPPPWAPAHGYRAKHRYVYYPDGEIYYAPDSRLWFWLSGSGWSFGASLPLEYQPYVRTDGVALELSTDRPYEDHANVIQRYGGRPSKFKDKGRGDGGPGKGHGRGKHGGD
jgi:hypothetical protein